MNTTQARQFLINKHYCLIHFVPEKLVIDGYDYYYCPKCVRDRELHELEEIDSAIAIVRESEKEQKESNGN